MQVVVAQLGARDHYAFARAFERERQLMSLITDFWWKSGLVPPGEAGQRLAGRWHPDLSSADVRSSNLQMAGFEMGARIRPAGHWETIMARNSKFQRHAIRKLSELDLACSERGEGNPVIFSYSYAARDLFKWAKARGWRTVLGQIDPGPFEDRLVRDLRCRYPEFQDQRKPAPEDYLASWREELKLSDAIVVNSEWSLRAMRSEGISTERIHVVSIPFEADGPRAERVIPKSFTAARPLRLLFLGQANLRKGLAELLEAMSRLAGLPVVLDVVGRCDLKIPERFESLPNVVWHGGVPRQAARHYFDSADMFVLPTHSDGFGLTQLEALASGLPVLTSSSCASLVEDGRTGRVLGNVSAEAIEEVARDVMALPDQLEKWSRDCRVPERCQMESVSKQLAKIVSSL